MLSIIFLPKLLTYCCSRLSRLGCVPVIGYWIGLKWPCYLFKELMADHPLLPYKNTLGGDVKKLIDNRPIWNWLRRCLIFVDQFQSDPIKPQGGNANNLSMVAHLYM